MIGRNECSRSRRGPCIWFTCAGDRPRRASCSMTSVMFTAESGCADCPDCPMRHGGQRCVFIRREKRAGEVLYAEGDIATTLWFVSRGVVVLTRAGAGVECPQATRHAGGLIGVEALAGERYRDTARVVVPASLCAAPREVVDAWLGPPSPARALLMQLVSTQGDEPPRLRGPAIKRVASWLLTDGGAARGVPRQTIAQLLGLVPETLSRALAQLDTRGLIRVTRRSVEIRNRAELEALVTTA
jgi:CRP-like cAMP-binding protein